MWRCPWCNNEFVRKGNLKEHIRSHKNERPFKCVHCGQTFKWHSSHSYHESKGCKVLKSNQAMPSFRGANHTARPTHETKRGDHRNSPYQSVVSMSGVTTVDPFVQRGDDFHVAPTRALYSPLITPSMPLQYIKPVPLRNMQLESAGVNKCFYQ